MTPELVWPEQGKPLLGLRGGKPVWASPDRLAAAKLVEVERFGGDDNLLIEGNNLESLAGLGERLKARVQLVYVDPPFGTGRKFSSYDDRMGRGLWLSFMECRLRLLWDVLRPGGALYVHLDSAAAHYARVMLDGLVGGENFQREIIWRIGWVSGFKSRARNYIRNHDTILYYAKGKPRVFNKIYLPYPEGYKRRGGGEGKGYPLEDTWNSSNFDRLDSIQIKSFSKEKTGFSTQKNEALLERIVATSSDPGEIVLDAFAGSGTTLVVAHRLGRRFVGMELRPNLRRYILPRLRRAGASFTHLRTD